MRASLPLLFPCAPLGDGPFTAFYLTHGGLHGHDDFFFFSEAVVAQRKNRDTVEQMMHSGQRERWRYHDVWERIMLQCVAGKWLRGP